VNGDLNAVAFGVADGLQSAPLNSIVAVARQVTSACNQVGPPQGAP